MSTQSRRLGRVKMYIADKGYGFIAPDEEMPELRGGDLFFHIKNCVGINPTQLTEGVQVSFSIGEGRGRNAGRIQADGVSLFH